MKKIIYSLVVMTFAFFAASCQQENLEPVANGNFVTYTVQVPNVITTRATGTQRVDSLIYEVYREAEIADLTKSPIYEGTAVINESGTAELVMEFVRNQKFIVLFWAQNSNVTAYTTNDLRKVSLAQKLTANDFATEVFSGIDTVNDCVSANKGNVKLNRPIAQINIATSVDGLVVGDPAKGSTTDVALDQSELTVEGLFTTFNVYDKNVSGEADFSYLKAAVPDGEFKTDYRYVVMSYVGFADKAGTNVDVKFNIYTSEGKIQHTVNNVPVKPNYRTNILGNLITGTAGYAVSIDNNWATPDNNIEAVAVSNAADLQDAINNIQDGSTGNIQLEGDIDLGTLAGMISTKSSTPSYGLMIPPTKTLVLDLNGCTLKQEVEQTAAYSMIQNNGHLTIIDSKGTGKISYTDKGNGGEYVSNTIVNNATMIIESGVIENNSSANVAANGYPHPVDNNGNLTINGGTLSNNANYASMRIWCTTDENISVTINGGTFKGSIDFQTVNSSPNKGVLTINGGTFEADTYTNSAVRLLGFGADVDEMFGYIKGGNFTGEIAIRNWSGQEMNSQVFYISGGTFNTDVNNFTAETSVAIKEGEVWAVRDAYARIGNTKYTSLEAALEAASDKETVTVLADTEIGAPFTLATGKTLSLDLNGKTVAGSSSDTSKNYDMIDVRGTLTVSNGTITAEFKGENMGWNHSTNVFNVTAGGVLNLNGVTAKNLGGSDMGFVAHLNNWGEVTLNVENSTLESNYVAVRVFNSGYDMNNVTIKNSTLKGGSYAFWVHNYTTADFGGDAEKAAQQQALLNLDIFDNGNTFIGKNDTPIRYGMTDAVYTAVPAAAKIGDIEYPSLQAAIDAADNGETIVLMRDVKQVDGVLIENKNLSVDLNDNTFTVTEGANVNNRNFKVSGTSVVTIKNGTMIAEGQLTSGAYGTVRTEDTANVTLENLKLYSYRGYGLNVKANTGTTININNSEIYSQYSGGVEAAGGTIELTNVKIEQNGVYSGAAWCSVAIGVNGGGKVTVNSGEYYAEAIASDSNAAQGTWVAYVMSSGGTLDINGGTFNGVVAETAAAANACGIICADRAAVVNVYDGIFNSNGAIFDMRNNAGTQPNPVVTLYGGNFSADPTISGLYSSNLIKVVDGKAATEGSDGRWTIERVQQSNEIWYTSEDKILVRPTNESSFGDAKIESNSWDTTIGQGILTFDRPLTTIGNEAFKYTGVNNWMTSISIPDSVQSIGDWAFYNAVLTSITIPDSVTFIGEYAFSSCQYAINITIGSGVTSIASAAFRNCYEVTEIISKAVVPPAVADSYVFDGLDKLSKVIVPASSVDAYKAADFWKDLNIVTE